MPFWIVSWYIYISRFIEKLNTQLDMLVSAAVMECMFAIACTEFLQARDSAAVLWTLVLLADVQGICDDANGKLELAQSSLQQSQAQS